jgi:DnaK suppressor protein
MTETDERLAALRAELQGQMQRISTIDPGTIGIGFGKRIGDGTNIAVDRMEQVKVHDQMGHKLAEVDRAERKVAEGTYGICDTCGATISAERLEHLPAAAECVACASRPSR